MNNGHALPGSSRLEAYHEWRKAAGVGIQDLYVCAGNRTYIIGTQDGDFPDFGHHQPDEMGGLWNHPIKLLDGFWLHLSTWAEGTAGSGGAASSAASAGRWLDKAATFHNYPYYNRFTYSLPEMGVEAERHQFCPDDEEGFVITYTLRDTTGKGSKLLTRFVAHTDLSPVWFSEQGGIVGSEDEGEYDSVDGVFRARDRANPWFVQFGSDAPCIEAEHSREALGPRVTAGQGMSAALAYAVDIPAGGQAQLRFFIAGSCTSAEAAKGTYAKLAAEHAALLEGKRVRYERLLGKAAVSIPDAKLQYVFDWVKFHTDWLVREVPGIGRGLGAGLPEYPWWFGCDNSYALLGLLPVGQQQLALETSDLIRTFSEQMNGNGRIIHELTTAGLIVNPGNTQETPHYIQCTWELFEWTGDIEFLRRAYPTVKLGLEWLLGEMDPDGDLLPEGYGITEIEGLNVELIDSAVYLWSALLAAAKMAVLFQEPGLADHYTRTAEQLGRKINRDLWVESEGLYADAMAPVHKVVERMPVYIERARGMGAEPAAIEMEQMLQQLGDSAGQAGGSGDGNGSGIADEERAWLFKNWVINTPMEVGLAPQEQAIRALDRMGTAEFTGPWGTYLSGMYQTQMMTISTGVQAVAEARYGRMDEALRYMQQIASTFNVRLPGSISEMSPDYGCFVQAWTNYGIVWPLLRHMFGIRPESYWKKLHLRPRLPSSWRQAAVRDVEIGLGECANKLDLSIELGNKQDKYELELQADGWVVHLNIPFPSHAGLLLNGQPIEPSERHDADGSITVAIEGAGKHAIIALRSE